MPTLQDVQNWRGQDLHSSDGDKIGKVEEIYLDRQTEEPEWLAVKTGMFGSNISFVPIQQAKTSGDGVSVPFSKDQVKDAPNVEADGELSEEEERRLYDHYGQDFGDFDYDSEYERGQTRGRVDVDRDRGTVGRDTSGPATDDAMTRSEEELRVGKTQRETGRARLRKYVETEPVSTTVGLQREEVRIEREPITDANAGDAMDGPSISEEEHEVTLTSEEAVVEKRVVPKERIRMDKEVTTEEREITDEVRKERIEVDGDVDVADRDRR